MKEITLTRGKVALVDDEDYEFVSRFKWYAIRPKSNGSWYAKRHVGKDRKGNPYVELMHRFVLGSPSSIEIDHEDCNGLNNQKRNLRTCNYRQNGGNHRKKSGYTSKYKGVSWNARDKRWILQYRSKGDAKSASFKDEVAAAKAYDAWAISAFGKFARINFPTPEYPNGAI